MKKIVNIIQKSNQIKNRFINMVKGGRHNHEENHGHHNHHDHDEEELDNHNDPHNWSYS